ncbi:hypothetical protein ABEB36_011629 [Hypothenemus hampei]|uniref:BZIP domain-containing protein n=1 Tax=Hypothenemus hampei TaxID=57062 RepID=A0ABD1E993_HYPHA
MWPDEVNFTEDYGFKCSPESISDTSFCTDNMDSDEHLMAQLVTQLDLPHLPKEQQLYSMSATQNYLPSDDLLLEFPIFQEDLDIDMKSDFDFLNDELLIGNTDNPITTFEENKSHHQEQKNLTSYFDYLNSSAPVDFDDIKSEEQSEESCSSNNSLEPSTPPPITSNKNLSTSKFFPASILPKKDVTASGTSTANAKVPIKRIPIKPKTSYTLPTNGSNIVVIRSEFSKQPNTVATQNNVLPNIFLLDNIPLRAITPTMNGTVNGPVTNANHVPTISLKNKIEIDPKMLKRQERRIKNRESASISRKKKRDYLNSLEEKVKVLTEENRRLIEENASLKEKLSYFGNSVKTNFGISSKNIKPTLVLCAFLFFIGLNVNLKGLPLKTSLTKKNSETSVFPQLSKHYSRHLLWANSEDSEDGKLNNTYFSPLTMCPASINQTESARLLLELERWIGKPEQPKPPMESSLKPINHKYKSRRKKLRLESSLAQLRRRDRYDNEFKNEIQVFRPKVDQLYSEFYEAINRRDDTFYVVSFSEQHMLLPALYHNNTRRPKMSLLMPSVFPNDTSNQNYIPLMQIDCEVLDTKLINVKYGSIPRAFRHSGNTTSKAKDRKSDRTDNSTNFDKNGFKKTYKPYFLSKNFLKEVDYNN